MINRRHRSAVLAVFCVLGPFVAPASAQQVDGVPAGPLTLEQVLTLAESRSETIAISRAGVQRAEGEQVRARSGLNLLRHSRNRCRFIAPGFW